MLFRSKDHSLTIGANGRITAEVHAKNVVVVGQVVGNITADDKVEVAPSGSVQGDVRAPRVAIADGAKFKGSIDMERKAPGAAATVSASQRESQENKENKTTTPTPPAPSSGQSPGLPASSAGSIPRGTPATKS